MVESAEKKEIEEITSKEYDQMKSKLKKKKAPDEEGWRYEWIENAGKDLEESIKLMMNESRKEKIQPEQWSNMRIKSTTKKPCKLQIVVSNQSSGLFEEVPPQTDRRHNPSYSVRRIATDCDRL